ncbi:recombinase family protein [Planctomycetota bacterium]
MTRIFGYCRTADYMQTASLEEQRELIEQATDEIDGDWQGCRAEHDSHPWSERPGFQALINEMQTGDHLVVHELKQIDSSTSGVTDAVDRLRQQDIHIHVLDVGTGMGLNLSPVAARIFVEVWRWCRSESARSHGQAIRDAFRWRKGTSLPASGRPGLGRKRITRGGRKIDVWDRRECSQIREIKHRHDQGEAISSIARSFYSRRLRTANGVRWVRRYGAKQQLNANRIYRALRFYENLISQGKELGA